MNHRPRPNSSLTTGLAAAGRMLPHVVAAGCLGLACSVSSAQLSVADFESGLPPSWVIDGPAWSVGGATGTSPDITPPQGSFFARSGAPNMLSGPLAESLVGSLTSAPLTVSHQVIQWRASGWSGQFGSGGLSRFEILDAALAVKATVSAPLTDGWVAQNINLLSSGLAPGDTFYFRAIDGESANNYAWLAVDDIQLVGAVPEPGTAAVLSTGIGLLWLFMRRETRRAVSKPV